MKLSQAVRDALSSAIEACDTSEALEALVSGIDEEIRAELADAIEARKGALAVSDLLLADAGLAEILEARPDLVDHVIAHYGQQAASDEEEEDDDAATDEDESQSDADAADDETCQEDTSDSDDDAASGASDENDDGASEEDDESEDDDDDDDENDKDEDSEEDDVEQLRTELAEANARIAELEKASNDSVETLRESASRLGVEASEMDLTQIAAALSDAVSRIPSSGLRTSKRASKALSAGESLLNSL